MLFCAEYTCLFLPIVGGREIWYTYPPMKRKSTIKGSRPKALKPYQKAMFRTPRQKILVCISLASTGLRNFFSGILRYADERTNWDIRTPFEPGDLTASLLDESHKNGIAGIILATPGVVDFDSLNRSQIPLVAFGGEWPELERRKQNFTQVQLDAFAHGAVGAKHLLNCRCYSSYGFVRSRFEYNWSRLRQKGFVETMRKDGEKPVCYELPPGETQMHDMTALCDWLATLPKPAAVMADDDMRAAQVVAACHDGGMDVPRDVAVLGVDDDPYYALHTRPPLSSVMPEHAEAGYLSARELDRIITSKETLTVPKKFFVSPKGVVSRESTRPVSASISLARRAATFIQSNAANGIKVIDVVRHLRCSRRIAEARFKQVKKQTIADFIAECRLNEVKQRIKTSATVAEIAVQCGFKSPAHLSRLFKQRIGQSISDWRRQFPAPLHNPSPTRQTDI